MIVRGTTPTHSFTLPVDASQIACARFVYTQEGEVKIKKEGADVKLEGNQASTTLTQNDTLKLKAGVMVSINLKGKTVGGQSLATENPVRQLCVCCGDNEVI